MGGYSLGLTVGPALGGLLYESWGFAAPFVVSAVLALPALLLVATVVPETRPTRPPSAVSDRGGRIDELLASLPRPLSLLATLLLLDFLAIFVYAFVEPEFAFYVYEALAFSPTQFGLIIGAYGLAMGVGQAATGHLSDRFGRRPLIVLGFLLNVAFYLSVIVLPDFGALLLTGAVAGLGTALLTPALSAAYLDIAAERYRSRVMGLKESAGMLGGVAGPLLVALSSRWATPQMIFAVAVALPVLAALLALVALTGRSHSERQSVSA
jgi:predicted MFS family arabinose efflux permease